MLSEEIALKNNHYYVVFNFLPRKLERNCCSLVRLVTCKYGMLTETGRAISASIVALLCVNMYNDRFLETKTFLMLLSTRRVAHNL